MHIVYVVKRYVEGFPVYLGEFDNYSGTFLTGVPKEFSKEQDAIDIATALNKFIPENSTSWIVYEMKLNEKFSKLANVVMPIEITDHEADEIDYE